MTIVANDSITVSNVNDGAKGDTGGILGENQWIGHKYSYPGSTRIYPNFDHIKGLNPIVTQIFDDSTMFSFSDDYYIAHFQSNLYVNIDKQITTTVGHDDDLTIYCNDEVVVSKNTTIFTPYNITFNLKEGWNKIDILLHELSGGDQVIFGTKLSSLVDHLSYIKGPKGDQGIKGNDGIAGKDGVGIKTTIITYAISTNETTAPATGWTSSVPSLVKGQYLWTKTVWTYTDNSSETGYSVTYISKDGNNGTNGIAGKDGVGIKTTTVTYASHTNGTIAPTTGYTTTVPSVPAGQFLWTKTVWTYTDNSFEIGYSVAMMGLKGDKGDTGASGRDGIAGKDGKGIKATAITYQASTNGTTAPTGTWSASVPPVAKGSFLWTRTIWTYTDNATETGYAVAYMGTNGNNGNDGVAGKDGVGIKTTTITYAGSTSGTTVPTSGWTSTVPTVAAGSYLWTKTVWTYTDNTSETGYSVGKMGDTGPAGPAGSDGNPGKIVSDTEPTTKFKGLAWKYSGAVDMTLGNGTKILAETEYYWNGTAWALYEINAHNINGDNLSVTNGTFKDGKIESVWGSNGVNGTTTIEGSHLQIHSSDSTTNTENTVAIDNRQGYAQVYTDHNTGRAITVQTSFQGFFVSDSTGPYVRVTPNGIKTSSDKSYNSFQIGAGITINLERRGDIVEATLSGSINSPLSSNTKFVVGTIPVGYRPNRLAYIMVHMTSTNNSSHIDVEPNGLCTWWGTSYNAGAPRGNQMWFTDDPLQN